MKIFIISIEDNESPRLNSFLSQHFFVQEQTPFTKIGIKGVDLSVKQYFEYGVQGRPECLTPGEVGCTLSHLSALEHFLKSDDQFAFILEDDAIFPENLDLKTLLHELESTPLPENLLFSLGGIQMKVCDKVRGKYCAFDFLGQKVLEVVPDFYHRVNYAVAYVVDRKMAKTLLAYHQPIRRADDWSYLYDFDASVHLLMTKVIDHPVIVQGESNPNLSWIEQERVKKTDLKTSKYGTSLRKNVSKLFTHRY